MSWRIQTVDKVSWRFNFTLACNSVLQFVGTTSLKWATWLNSAVPKIYFPGQIDRDRWGHLRNIVCLLSNVWTYERKEWSHCSHWPVDPLPPNRYSRPAIDANPNPDRADGGLPWTSLLTCCCQTPALGLMEYMSFSKPPELTSSQVMPLWWLHGHQDGPGHTFRRARNSRD